MRETRQPPPGTVRFPLQRKLTVLLLLAALVPAALAGVVVLRAASGIGREAASRVRQAAEARAVAQLGRTVDELARRDDLIFARARADAVALGNFASFLYDHPEYFPHALPGNTPLAPTPQGHLVNRPEATVGVFMPRQERVRPEVWREVALLSHLDPLLISLSGRTPHVASNWVLTASGFIRIYPNLQLGQPGSPVGPAYDLQADVMFTAAAPAQNPGRGPVWTPPFRDPAGQGLLITAAVPVYDREGVFHAVAGVNMSLEEVVESVLAAQGRTLLVDGQGRIIAASRQTLAELGVSTPDIRPGAPLAASLDQVRDQRWRETLRAALAGAEAGVRLVESPGEPFFLAHARLPSTGWTLLMLVPEADVLAGARETSAAVSEAFRLLGWLVVLGLALLGMLVLVVSPRVSRRLTGPLERLSAGTRRVAAGDLSFRVRPESNDEIGLLAGEFNRMAERLQELYGGLERQVAERTQALRKSTARLRALHALAQEIAALGERGGTPWEGLSARLGEVFGYDGAAVWLQEDGRPEAAGWGTLQDWPGGERPGWPEDAGARRIDDLAAMPLRGWPAEGSAAAVPVVDDGEVRAWLAVHMRRPGLLQAEDEESLATLAGHLAVCLANRRLLRQAGEAAVLEERNRMAREIHDTLAQGFTGVLLQLEAAEQVLPQEPGEAGRHLERARQLAREGLAEARRSVWNLRPATLEGRSLVDALAGLAHRLEAEGLAVEVALQPVDLPPPAEEALLRVAQEALHNVRRHAQARRVRLELAASPAGVTMRVADDGCGMDTAEAAGRGFGLAGMQERLRARGGWLEIDSAPGRGTVLQAHLPARPEEGTR